MFHRILVANRGEIALRVIRAAREMGIDTVAVYSKADEGAAYLDLADERICIGPAPSGQSYLSIPSIIAAAEVVDVDAIHPGYGFLSENAEFAQTCRDHGIEFIGPDADTMRKLGDKATARDIAKQAKVPVVPGSDGLVQDEKAVVEVAEKIGYPVLIKATAGGGGRGMRVANGRIALVNAWHQARAEAQSAFGEAGVYLEKYLERPRHVEIQILADGRGRIVYLGERECSVQRRHQKLVEEGPSPGIGDSMRRAMGRAAVKLAKAAGYKGAGTCEFLVAGKDFYFIEVNCRVQVEHPVTELITGVDIVREQIRVAAGEKLSFDQGDVRVKGHAIEARINAEDPARGFRPSPGVITKFIAPGGPGVRLDTHVHAGYKVPPNYDSLLAKLIVHAATRDEALDRMARALDEFTIEGIKTTIPLHREIVRNAFFRKGDYDTGFLDEYLAG
ncbi:MAG TPA: acetyl-CoA carboxylase biotin carboxylase subunit [Planctomycetota bacterium]|nr:acetyl-CoA carboxylase biotin carboxylase subunit [Planctomycetota bacterium]